MSVFTYWPEPDPTFTGWFISTLYPQRNLWLSQFHLQHVQHRAHFIDCLDV